jgi:DNA cross-link repair 1A protein
MLVEYSANYDKIIAIKPTGWTFSSKSCKSTFNVKSLKPQYLTPKITLVPLPYSEHSSFSELKMFVEALKPKTVIPTVNMETEKGRNEMKNHFDSWRK